MPFEHKKQPLLPRHRFVWRLLRSFVYALLVIALSLFAGMAGYHYLARLPWIDSYENAAMILSGMGPVDELHDNTSKIFAGTYALFSGIVFLVIIGIVAAPIYHRFLHQFHIDDK